MDIDEGIDDAAGVEQYAALVQEQLELVGEDSSREGLLRTPERVAKAMQFLTRATGFAWRTWSVQGSSPKSIGTW